MKVYELFEAKKSIDFEQFSKDLTELFGQCEQYIKNNKQFLKKGIFLYRETSEEPNKTNKSFNYFIKSVRKNRNPRDTSKNYHIKFDNYFFKKFGIKYRSQSVFCQASTKMVGDGYGDFKYIIFPIDDYKMCYSPKIKDLVVIDPNVGNGQWNLFKKYISSNNHLFNSRGSLKSLYFKLFVIYLDYPNEFKTIKNSDTILSSLREITVTKNDADFEIVLDEFNDGKSNKKLTFNDILNKLEIDDVAELIKSFDETFDGMLDILSYVETETISKTSQNEIMLYCDSYIAIPAKYRNDLMGYFENDNI